MKTFRLCLILFALITAVCRPTEAKQQDSSKAELRVLFIGNSLTYVNDLPAIVEAMAKATKQKQFNYKSIAYPDFSLEDHWKQGEAKNTIAKGKWDVVVLQQGPSALEESRKLLLEYTRLFDKEIRVAGGKTALFMVWPSASRSKDFDRIVESWKLAADDIRGILFPVGQAWLEAWKRDATLPLYSSDGFHPSAAGSYLAALVIYEKLYGQTSVGLPASLKLRSATTEKVELPQKQAEQLQKAAAEANKKF